MQVQNKKGSRDICSFFLSFWHVWYKLSTWFVSTHSAPLGRQIYVCVCVCMNQTELFTEQTLSQHRNADEHTNSCSFSVRTSPPLGHADRWDGKCVTGSTSRLLQAAILEQMGGFQFSCICASDDKRNLMKRV